MSGVVRAVGKVFKKVVKVAKVVLPIALAAAAVVFTGGAALGLAPTFATAVGGVVSSLGLSGAIGGALTGAVVSAGFGAAAGGALAGVTGGNIMKGMQKGALTGAVTGGALGAISPASFGMGAAAKGASAAGEIAKAGVSKASSGLGGGVGDLFGESVSWAPQASQAVSAAPSVAASAAPAVAGAPAAAAGSGGLGSFFSNPMNMMMAGNVVSGLFSESDSPRDAARAQDELERERGERLFSDIYSNPQNGTAFGTPTMPTPQSFVRSAPRFRFNRDTLEVEEVSG